MTCNPHNAPCFEGTRLIPIELIDVAGLVPGAHEGKGLGNKFLDDLMQAKVFIHVIDASGSTDEEGNSTLNLILMMMKRRRLLKNPNQKLIKDRLQKNWKLLEIELLKEPVLI